MGPNSKQIKILCLTDLECSIVPGFGAIQIPKKKKKGLNNHSVTITMYISQKWKKRKVPQAQETLQLHRDRNPQSQASPFWSVAAVAEAGK